MSSTSNRNCGKRSSPPKPNSAPALFEECRQTMGSRRSLTLLEAPELDGPALFGCFRLKLLLPEKMIGAFSPAELRHVCLHEPVHIRRWDAAVNCLTTLLQTLHWCNPVLWFSRPDGRRIAFTAGGNETEL